MGARARHSRNDARGSISTTRATLAPTFSAAFSPAESRSRSFTRSSPLWPLGLFLHDAKAQDTGLPQTAGAVG